ncbi:MAG: hypothetical protein U1F56_20530 [Rubrivivax sp.]
MSPATPAMRRAALVLAAWGLSGATLAQGAGDAARLEAAHEAYDIGHYAQAFDAFAQLADGGHCEAARMARQMLQHGRTLYGIAFSVPPERRSRWQRAPGCPAPTALHPPTQPGAPT